MNEKYANIRPKMLLTFPTFYFIDRYNLVSTGHIALTLLNLLICRIKFKSYKVLSKCSSKN